MPIAIKIADSPLMSSEVKQLLGHIHTSSPECTIVPVLGIMVGFELEEVAEADWKHFSLRQGTFWTPSRRKTVALVPYALRWLKFLRLPRARGRMAAHVDLNAWTKRLHTFFGGKHSVADLPGSYRLYANLSALKPRLSPKDYLMYRLEFVRLHFATPRSFSPPLLPPTRRTAPLRLPAPPSEPMIVEGLDLV